MPCPPQVAAVRPAATIIVRPEAPPCALPKWPSKPVPGGVPQGQNVLYTPDGLAEWARFLRGATAYYDANELCRKAARQ